MVMIPPLVRDPPLDGQQGSTGRPVSGRMVRPQRRYASNFNISFEYEPPRPIPKPGVPPPASTFDKWRAAAELDPPGGGAGDPSKEAARGEASASGVAAAPRRTLHDVLLGTTAVALLGLLGGIGYAVWSGAVPGATAPGGPAPKGSGVAAAFRSLGDLAAQAVARPSPERAAALPAAQDAATDIPTPRPAPPPTAPQLPSTAPTSLALAAPLADKPALAGPSPPASGSSAVAADAVPAPGRAASEPAPWAKPSEPGAAEAVPLPASAPAPEQAAAATVPPAKAAVPDATPPMPAVPAKPAPTGEQAAATAVPPAKPPVPDAAPPVPSAAPVTVRLPPAPEWTTAPPAALASPVLSAGPAAVPDEAAQAVPAGVDAQQVVSTMTLVQQMSLLVHDMHDEGLRYRTEVTALTGAVQAKASSLEERLRLAEARNAAGPDAGGSPGGLPGSDAPQVLRGYRVQAGSPGAAVLTDMGAGAERAARLLVMVGDQLPGAGRVTAIVQRGRAWIVRTERGVIQ